MRQAAALLVAACVTGCGGVDVDRPDVDRPDARVVASRMGVSFAKVITEARPGFDAVTVKRCRLEGDEDLWSVEVPTGARLFVANRSQLVWVDDGARDEEPAVVVYRDGGIVATYPRSALAEYDVVGRFDARVVWGRGEEALRVQADGSPDAYLVDFEGHGLWPDR